MSQLENTIMVWVDGQAFYGLDGHTIGRDPTASITVDHAHVSRSHAALQYDGSGWAIRDLDSMNGLHVSSGRHQVVRLPPGRTQVWLGPPESSPSLYFDVSGQPGPGGGGPPPQPQPQPPQQPQQPPVQDPSAQFQQPYQAPPGGPDRYVPQPPPPVGPPESPPLLNTAALEHNIGQLSQVIDLGEAQAAFGAGPDKQLLLGRATECDISIPDPLVSRRHAQLFLNEQGGRIVDLGSDNGTFVNGQRVVDAPVAEGDLIELGKAQFVLSGGGLRQYAAHGLPLQAERLSVTVGNDLVILNDISFTLPAGSMTAVVGPSGCGKSTLLNALTGRRPADVGRVVLGGRDLYAADEGLGRRIGFVPQDDPVHLMLTVRQALTAAAKLRLPSDTTKAEIQADVEQVATELGMAERLDTKIRQLSGGQRKRVSVGYELVGEPQALILDEPTSGLDPGLERDLMTSLRQLADKGTTTIVVTHSVQSVELCDLVIVMAPGGRLAFIGPHDKVSRHFNCGDLASVFTLLGTRQRAEWELEFARTTSYQKFGAPAPVAASAPSVPLPPRKFFTDLRVMLGRYTRSLAGDPKRLIVLLLQAPLLGLLLALVLPTDAFRPGGLGVPGGPARQYLLATVLVMVLLGGFNSVREIVQDRDVFLREKAVGVSAFGFVLARWILLSLIAVLQAVLVHVIASSRQSPDLGSGQILNSGSLELIVALIGIGIASVGIGLLISALVSDAARALTALPLVILAALLLSGLVVPTSGPGLQEVTYLNPIQWGGSSAAVTVDLRAAEGCPLELVQDDSGQSDTCGNARWERTSSTQTMNLGLLGFSAVVLLCASGFAATWSFSRPQHR